MILLIITMGAIALIDVPPLLKARPRSLKTIIVYAVFYLIAFTAAVLLVKGVKLPSSMLFLDKIFKSIGLAYPP